MLIFDFTTLGQTPVETIIAGRTVYQFTPSFGKYHFTLLGQRMQWDAINIKAFMKQCCQHSSSFDECKSVPDGHQRETKPIDLDCEFVSRLLCVVSSFRTDPGKLESLGILNQRFWNF